MDTNFLGGRASLGYVRRGSAWPVPDAILVGANDTANEILCAIEFKPPHSSKSECVRGLGQCVTYLTSYHCAGLILPRQANDGYPISSYLAALLSAPPVVQERVGVFAYPLETAGMDTQERLELDLLKPIGGISAAALDHHQVPRPERTFWAFWRDFSLQEFFLVLDSADRLAGDVHARTNSLEQAYAQYSALQTVDPQGRPRQRAAISESHFKGNISTSIDHLGFWQEDGVLSDSGRHLVHLGRTFGSQSAPFRDYFAREALLTGRHYEFVKLVYEFQRLNAGRFARADEFASALEGFLEAEGLLTRLPARRTTGGRRFFKAELTFWGVMLRIIQKRGNSYVVPGVGLDFNWPRIVDLLQ